MFVVFYRVFIFLLFCLFGYYSLNICCCYYFRMHTKTILLIYNHRSRGTITITWSSQFYHRLSTVLRWLL